MRKALIAGVGLIALSVFGLAVLRLPQQPVSQETVPVVLAETVPENTGPTARAVAPVVLAKNGQGSAEFVRDSKVSAVSTETTTNTVSVPMRLRIPSAGVDAAVEPVVLTPEGAMGVPEKPMDAGWYSLGPRPGDVGSAVIDGHVDWYHGATGVFGKLRKVVVGDHLSVVDEGGQETFFVVREVRTYDAAADATGIFFSTDDKAHLNLITCEGAWNALTKQYGERLVVFADGV